MTIDYDRPAEHLTATLSLDNAQRNISHYKFPRTLLIANHPISTNRFKKINKKLLNSAKVFLPNERTFFISFTLSFLASRTPLMCDAVPGRSHCPSEQRASRRVVFHTAETRHTRPQDTVLEALWNIFIIQLLACSFNGACRGRVVVFYNCGWLFHLFIRFSLLRFNCKGKWRLAGRKMFIRKRRKGEKHKIRKLRV